MRFALNATAFLVRRCAPDAGFRLRDFTGRSPSPFSFSNLATISLTTPALPATASQLPIYRPSANNLSPLRAGRVVALFRLRDQCSDKFKIVLLDAQ
jgi:hypothetical protein